MTSPRLWFRSKSVCWNAIRCLLPLMVESMWSRIIALLCSIHNPQESRTKTRRSVDPGSGNHFMIICSEGILCDNFLCFKSPSGERSCKGAQYSQVHPVLRREAETCAVVWSLHQQLVDMLGYQHHFIHKQWSTWTPVYRTCRKEIDRKETR